VVAEDGVIQEETENGQETNMKALDHEQIVQLTDRFMELILQDIDGENKVLNYQSKEELMKAFEKISSREAAEPYVNYYFHEKQDGMYILPTEAPSWFMEDNEYDMIQIAENKMKLTQDNFMHIFGAYRIEIEFTFEDKWKITEIRHLHDEKGS
jgi:hydroxymethylpyrimidine pyrophosphatase-like HAD family hydrolase